MGGKVAAVVGEGFGKLTLHVGQSSAKPVVGVGAFPVVGHTAVDTGVVTHGVIFEINKRLACGLHGPRLALHVLQFCGNMAVGIGGGGEGLAACRQRDGLAREAAVVGKVGRPQQADGGAAYWLGGIVVVDARGQCWQEETEIYDCSSHCLQV